MDLKKYEEAIEDFTQAITIKPDVAVVYQMRGIAEFQASQYEEAVEDFTRAITIKSDYAEAYHNRGLAHKESGNLPEARRDLQAALHLAIDQNNQSLIELIKQDIDDLPPEDQKK